MHGEHAFGAAGLAANLAANLDVPLPLPRQYGGALVFPILFRGLAATLLVHPQPEVGPENLSAQLTFVAEGERGIALAVDLGYVLCAIALEVQDFFAKVTLELLELGVSDQVGVLVQVLPEIVERGQVDL